MRGAVVTVLGLGHLRPAPGTWASAAATLAALGLAMAGLAPLVPVGAVLATALGLLAVPGAIAGQADSDPSEIVIDEVAGQWLALSFTLLPLWARGVDPLAAWPGLVVPFLLFRLFDIWKPGPIGRADRRGDALGLMGDDLWAGLFAGVGSVILAAIWHGAIIGWGG
ncbi:MAG: phosphatidylglycerophosphatase A [Rubellimicrobium sp.]|nr:phosphatidylglycerophosphatase A [Rubellimicrobium sp.]